MKSKDGKFNIVSLVLLFYFLITYLINIEKIRGLIPYPSFIPLIMFSFGSTFILYSLVKDRGTIKLFAPLKPIYKYLVVLSILLGISSFFAVKIGYSLSRAFFSVGLIGVIVTVSWYLINIIERYSKKYGKILILTLFPVFIIAIFGHVFISEWRVGYGNIRLSGGIHPNYIAFLGLFTVVFTHYSIITKKDNDSGTLIYKIGWILGLTVLVWSFSRTNLLSLVVLYACYFLIKGLLYLKQNRLTKKVFIYILSLALVLIGGFLVYNKTSDAKIINSIVHRLTKVGSFNSRLEAWKVLMNYFKENIFFGRAGWWYSTHILSGIESSVPTAASPHSLYVRLLSEVGLVGFIGVLAMPFTIVIKLISKVLNKYKKKGEVKSADIFIMSAILAIFAGQFFEDKYMTGIGGMGNTIIIWIMMLGYYRIKCSSIDNLELGE